MDIETQKQRIIERILQTKDESLLDEISSLLDGQDIFLTEKQKEELSVRQELYKSGQLKTYSWEQSKERARSSR